MRSTDPVRSTTFHLRTPASPAAAWRALTCPTRTARYLGLSARTTWRAGEPLELRAPCGSTVRGTVLHCEAGVRLSVVLEESTYLTWTVRTCGDRTVVRLQVDEAGSNEDELEDVWLPVLDRLADLLRGETATAG